MPLLLLPVQLQPPQNYCYFYFYFLGRRNHRYFSGETFQHQKRHTLYHEQKQITNMHGVVYSLACQFFILSSPHCRTGSRRRSVPELVAIVITVSTTLPHVQHGVLFARVAPNSSPGESWALHPWALTHNAFDSSPGESGSSPWALRSC